MLQFTFKDCKVMTGGGLLGEQTRKPPGQVGLRFWDASQMHMIGHEDERIEDPPRAPCAVFQPREQAAAVGVIADDVLPGVAARRHVVDRIGVLDS
jgi:hypothetical protein